MSTFSLLGPHCPICSFFLSMLYFAGGIENETWAPTDKISETYIFAFKELLPPAYVVRRRLCFYFVCLSTGVGAGPVPSPVAGLVLRSGGGGGGGGPRNAT